MKPIDILFDVHNDLRTARLKLGAIRTKLHNDGYHDLSTQIGIIASDIEVLQGALADIEINHPKALQ